MFSEYLFVCLLKGMSYKTMLQNCEKNCQTDISLSFSLPHGFVAKVSLALFFATTSRTENAKFVSAQGWVFLCLMSVAQFCSRSKSVLVGSRGFEWCVLNVNGAV